MTDDRENRGDTRTDDRENRGDTRTDDRENRGDTMTDDRIEGTPGLMREQRGHQD